jgi:predicted secreted hydrolase
MRALLLLLLMPLLLAADYTPVRPGVMLRFPADHGAHPEFRTEWWYITGLLDMKDGVKGFQITFFRTKPGVAGSNPSQFAPRQVIFGHAAVSDPGRKRLIHSARIARAGFGLAQARVGDMDLVLDDWRLWRGPDGRMHAKVSGDGFALDLSFTPTQPVIVQGRGGYSRKGPSASEASHYYSWPQLAAAGRLNRQPVTGRAWLDREWSSTLLNPRAVGWDWLGLNLDDGGALTLFRVRDSKGGPVWSGGSHRSKAGKLNIFNPEDVRWQADGWWQSPRSKTRWPVQPAVEYRLNGRWQRLDVKPIMQDQELDSRAGGGPLYWEGAVTVPGGRGYLELTGYAAPLRM